MYKPRVIFPFTEAGLGHIVPMSAIADVFEQMYGDKVEVVRSQFFTESNQPRLALFEERLKTQVMQYNKHPSFGHFATFNMEFWKADLSIDATMKFLAVGSLKYGLRHMAELKPDMVVSTHWATNYYARKIKPKPLTVMYCPDTEICPIFADDCDLELTPTTWGYRNALKEYPKRFNEQNLIKVPYVIRPRAFELENVDKRELRIKNGLDPDKFTILLADGGYGIGKMEKICNIIIEKDLPVNLVPICGRNEELYSKFLKYPANNNTVFRPIGCLLKGIFEFMAASDVFCGKSGSMLAELTFFGVPQIVTHCANHIEEDMAAYYMEYAKTALQIFDESEVVAQIEQFMSEPQKLQVYVQNALKQHGNYGAEKSVEEIFNVLCARFPYLRDDTTN